MQQVQGITAAGALLDEVVLMPESFVNQVLARCSVRGLSIGLTVIRKDHRTGLRRIGLTKQKNVTRCILSLI